MKKPTKSKPRARRAPPPVSALKLWMKLATADEQEALAAQCETSRQMLYQVANGHRNFSAAKAGLIEAASAAMHKASRGRLPKLYRSDLAAACAGCAYARECLGPRAEFSLVDDTPGTWIAGAMKAKPGALRRKLGKP